MLPTLKDQPFGYLNLSAECEPWLRKQGFLDRPVSPAYENPALCQQMVDWCHRRLDIAWSYGGWFEWRDRLWKGGYQAATNSFLHLGMDVNAPAGTPVCVDRRARVVMTGHDPSKGGWGSYVLVEIEGGPVGLIYAHLDPALECKEYDVLVPGNILGKIGTPDVNGHWFSHLHVQTVIANRTERGGRLYRYPSPKDEGFDGYGRAEDMEELAVGHPDPMLYISFF